MKKFAQVLILALLALGGFGGSLFFEDAMAQAELEPDTAATGCAVPKSRTGLFRMRGIPAIDQAQVSEWETATFAVG